MIETHKKLSAKSEKALKYYLSEIKPQLADDDIGRYIVIDAETKEWEIGDTQDVQFRFWDRTQSPKLVMLRHPGISTGRLGYRLSQSF